MSPPPTPPAWLASAAIVHRDFHPRFLASQDAVPLPEQGLRGHGVSTLLSVYKSTQMCLSGSCFAGDLYSFFSGAVLTHCCHSFMLQPQSAQPDEWAFELAANPAQAALPGGGEGVCLPVCLVVHVGMGGHRAPVCMTLCACVFLCVHVCIGVLGVLCVSACVHVHVCVHVSVDVRVSICMQVCVVHWYIGCAVPMSACVHVHMSVCACAHMCSPREAMTEAAATYTSTGYGIKQSSDRTLAPLGP